MLSEQDKQAILNGASAVSRDGNKMQLVFISNKNNKMFRYLFIKDEKKQHTEVWLDKNLKYFSNDDCDNDVIGLWEESNELEPFNLERALNGEPVITKDGSKAFILKQINDNLIGYFDESSPARWDIDGTFDRAAEHSLDIIGMWQEPKRPTVTLTLPCPLKQPQEGMWLIGNNFDLVHPHPINIRNKKPESMQLIDECINDGRAFATKEDAIAWIDALSNSRR